MKKAMEQAMNPDGKFQIGTVIEEVYDVVRGSGPLSRFLEQDLTFPTKLEPHRSPPLFPIPVLPLHVPRRGRSRKRVQQTMTLRKFTNVIISVLNDQHGEKQPTTYEASRAQTRTQSMIMEHCKKFYLPVRTSAWSLAEIHKSINQITNYETVSQYEPLKPDKIKIPSEAGQVKLNQFISDPLLTKLLTDPAEFLLDQAQPTSKSSRTPVTPFDCSRAEEVAFFDDLIKKGVLSWLPEEKSHPVRSSLFAVPKDNLRQRLIANLVPSNNLFSSLRERGLPLPLPSVDDLKLIEIEKSAKVAVMKRDVADYFHQLGIETEKGYDFHPWQPYWGIKLPHWKGTERQNSVLSFKSLPMGFWGSVHLAQAAQEHFVREAGLPTELKIASDRPSPLSLPIWGVMIDDVFGISLKDCRKSKPWGPAVSKVWEAHDVRENEGKRVDWETDEILGKQVTPDGEVKMANDKMALVFLASMLLLGQDRPLRKSVAKILGRVVNNSLLRRSSLSLFDRLFRYYESKKDRLFWRECPWNELLNAVFVMPLININFKRPFSSSIRSSDACLTGLGGATAKTDIATVKKLCQSRCRKGAYTRLTENDTQLEVAEVGSTVRDLFWVETFVSRPPPHAKYGAHITLLETVALRMMIEQGGASDFGKRCVYLSDATAAVGCTSKGRSSSYLLNKECRKIFATICATDVENFVLYIKGADNTAAVPGATARGGC